MVRTGDVDTTVRVAQLFVGTVILVPLVYIVQSLVVEAAPHVGEAASFAQEETPLALFKATRCRVQSLIFERVVCPTPALVTLAFQVYQIGA